MSFAPDAERFAKPETLLRVPVGLASPLWGLFAGAAMTGATWWWMTRWARPANLEAMFGATAATPVEVEAATFAAPVAETMEAVIEAAPEPVLETLVEPEPVIEALVETPPEPPLEPVSDAAAVPEPIVEEATVVMAALELEAAPEPAPAPKSRKKAAAAEPANDETA